MAVRRQFARELAFWMWRNDLGSQIHSAKINSSLFKKYLSDDDDDIEAIKRDLLMGSVLERKPPTGFFFPHRSFQEFLVAEYLVEQVNKENFLLENCPFLTLEIQSFFVELIGRNIIIKWRNYHEKIRKIKNEDALELLRATCEILQLKYDSSLYKNSKYNAEIDNGTIQRRYELVNDILSFPPNNVTGYYVVKNDRKKRLHKQRGKTPKHKYSK
jgi:hypothetical protein